MNDCVCTHVERSPIDMDLARRQHAAYGRKLQALGVAVRTLDMNRQFPDCTFIEDTAIILDEVAIVPSMGTLSRSREPAAIESELISLREIRRISAPATIEGGDIVRLGRNLLVGLSSRTNRPGVDALEAIVAPLGYRVTRIPVRECLHLKTACTALPDGRLLINPHWLDTDALREFDCVPIPETEPWAANTLPIGKHVILSSRHPQTCDLISQLGFEVEPVDISEFAKAEGGVTCLSVIYDNG